MNNKQQKILALKVTIERMAELCYEFGKLEATNHVEPMPKEARQIPLDILEEIISEIESEPITEMGFNIIIPEIEKVKINK